MKTFLLLTLLSLLAPCAFAQETQVSTVFLLKQQTQLGYQPHSYGVKAEGDYNFSKEWLAVGYASFIHSPKVDSGTGTSYFGSLGTRYSPAFASFQHEALQAFGELDFIVGALNTRDYRKTVAHFRLGAGVKAKFPHEQLLLMQVSRLFQDILPDAAKLLSDKNQAALHTALNQLSGWDFEAQYWKRIAGPVGIKLGARGMQSSFFDNAHNRRHGWSAQLEVGPYWTF